MIMATPRTRRALQRGYAASAASARQAPVRVQVRRRAPDTRRRDVLDTLQVPPTRARSIEVLPSHALLQTLAS